jgi:hypothetical protein
MKKILISMLAIAITIGAVTSSAYALFSDTVKVAGVTITSGNADLKITDVGTDTLVSSWQYANGLSSDLSNLYPGKVDGTWMKFTNQSKSEINLDLSAQITTYGGNWNDLYNKIQLAILDKTHSINSNPPTESEWHDLSYWYASPRSFGSVLNSGKDEEYRLFMRVKGIAGNEIAGKYLNNLTLTFTGTQEN